MKYAEIQQQRRRAEKLINRAMNHAREGQHGLCAGLMQQASDVLSLITNEISNGDKGNSNDLNILKVARLARHAGISWSVALRSLVMECGGHLIPVDAGVCDVCVPPEKVSDFKALIREIAPVHFQFNVVAISQKDSAVLSLIATDIIEGERNHG